MSDLVTRLRSPIKHPQENVTQRQEAADMIESLSNKKVYVPIEDMLDKHYEETEALHRRISELEYLLNECAAHLEDTADADYDGERWQPNDSMKLVEMIDELVGKPE